VPPLAGHERLRGLEAPVEVWRDAEGIPHVLARTTHDAFFAQGFVHAQDRLWHMDRDRRVAQGRWAEDVGVAAVAQDVQMRRLGLALTARRDHDHLDADTRALLLAYAAGVNAFLASRPDERALPVEHQVLARAPEPWAPWDSLAVMKVRHADMGVWQAKRWRALLVRELGPARAAALCPGTPERPVLILPPGVRYDGPPWDPVPAFEAGAAALAGVALDGGGSNSWALHGARTASGRPLLAGDPHRALEVPNVYYQNHVAGPEFDAIGLSFPGVPGFPHFGHTRWTAWCVTHAMADYQDLFVERFDPADPARYAFRGGWRRAEVRRETVRVRDGAPVEVEVTVTHHGPVVLGDPRQGTAVALAYTAIAAPNPTLEATLPMLRARDADALEAAMRPWVDPANNFVFADVHGAIGYRTRGQVPVRPAANAWLPVPGWDGAHEWTGTVPFEAMPAARDPEGGVVVTANGRIAGPPGPYLGLDYAPDYRTRRIHARLAGLGPATAEDMAAVHADRLALPARELAAYLAALPAAALTASPGPGGAAGDAAASEAAVAAALDLLRAWDGVMDEASAAAAVVAVTREHLVRDLLAGPLGPLAAEAFGGTPRGAVAHVGRLRARLGEWATAGDRRLLGPGDDWPAAAARALRAAVADLTARLGPGPAGWTWGRLHAARPRHPLSLRWPALAAVLDPAPLPLGGDGETVQAAGYSAALDYEVTLTSVARYVFDLADWERSGWVVPLGASGHPGSPHYADQAGAWRAVRLLPMRFGWDRVRREAAGHQRLDPA
jgi:penicillin amidase